jgi:protein O-GlcNAc transferase
MLRNLLRSLMRSGSPRFRWVGQRRGAQAFQQFELAQREASMGRLGAAEVFLRNAISLDKSSPELHYNLGLLLHGVGDVRGAEGCYVNALELNPDYQAAHSSYLCLCDFSPEISGEDSLQRHKDWASRYADVLLQDHRLQMNARDPRRRLRLGYISADFKEHVIGRFIGPILENHDPRRFDVYCYSASPVPDSMTDRLSRLVPNWREVYSLHDAELADRIRGDEIDILVDLSGHSAGNRLLALALKPAPIQMTWMGYLNTSGMAAMDFKCTDLVADPVGVESQYRERLLRLGRTQWCFDSKFLPVDAKPIRVRPVERRADGAIRMGCMARFMKISDLCATTWVEVLRRNSRFQLEIVDAPDHPRREWMWRLFADAGVGGQVTFLPTLRSGEYWSKFENLDIVLDPFPYTGATTTIDALAMGVPVVTLAGVCGAARSAASILSDVGLGGLLTNSTEEYVEAVCRLAQDIVVGQYNRNDIRSMFLSAGSSDARRFTDDWERRLLTVWSEWCAPSNLMHGTVSERS